VVRWTDRPARGRVAILYWPKSFEKRRRMSLAGNITDVRGVVWGKYVDESDGSCFYVNS
jgi:hypothetical protein